ncbi:hypothetical protein Tco_0728714 [Tanacetum coccineum]|uniref:Tf2-1-like SH3-like domain-containing protein n=1 Tax=Tanacetum coccineum TaxID=301880 RepID=A0ABQ4YQD2_9ASTR
MRPRKERGSGIKAKSPVSRIWILGGIQIELWRSQWWSFEQNVVDDAIINREAEQSKATWLCPNNLSPYGNWEENNYGLQDCADNRRKLLEFEVGDHVMLKVSPWKGVVRFGKKGKLAPRYVGLFEILERIGPVAYRLRLPKEFSGVHDTFHMSNLKKCLADASMHVPLNEIKVDKTLCFIEKPVEILDREIKSLKRSKISLVKVHWDSKRGPEFTWEREDYMKSMYPQLFIDRADESAN